MTIKKLFSLTQLYKCSSFDNSHPVSLREKNMRDIMDKLWTFTGPQLRMIWWEYLVSGQSGTMSSLKSLARDMVLVSIITNNSHEMEVKSLVERLREEDITKQVRDILLRPRRGSAWIFMSSSDLSILWNWIEKGAIWHKERKWQASKENETGSTWPIRRTPRPPLEKISGRQAGRSSRLDGKEEDLVKVNIEWKPLSKDSVSARNQ